MCPSAEIVASVLTSNPSGETTKRVVVSSLRNPGSTTAIHDPSGDQETRLHGPMKVRSVPSEFTVNAAGEGVPEKSSNPIRRREPSGDHSRLPRTSILGANFLCVSTTSVRLDPSERTVYTLRVSVSW